MQSYDFWNERKISKITNIEQLETFSTRIDEDIEELKQLKKHTLNRIDTLKKANWKYFLRMFYVEPHRTEYGDQMGYYGVVLLYIPIIDGVVGDSIRIDRREKTYFYSSALKDFNELKEKYKNLDLILVNEVPDEMKHEHGDL